MAEKELHIGEERRKIAYRLFEHLTFDELISDVTKLTLVEVCELRQRREDDYKRRKKMNPFYQYQGMELIESDYTVKYKSDIWTKHHEQGAVRVLKENIQQFKEMLVEETDENKRATLIKMLKKMECELRDRN